MSYSAKGPTACLFTKLSNDIHSLSAKADYSDTGRGKNLMFLLKPALKVKTDDYKVDLSA